MPHDHVEGRNHRHAHHNAPPDHLHSHMAEKDRAEEIQALTAEFMAGFRASDDKQAYLRISRIPLERPDPDGGPSLKLVDVRIESAWAVGAASPAFGSRELSYMPMPGPMIKERANMKFVYVSIDRVEEVDLRDIIVAQAD